MFHMAHSPGEIALYQRKLNRKVFFFLFFFFLLFYIITSVLDLRLLCIFLTLLCDSIGCPTLHGSDSTV